MLGQAQHSKHLTKPIYSALEAARAPAATGSSGGGVWAYLRPLREAPPLERPLAARRGHIPVDRNILRLQTGAVASTRF
jgi:hypothetical protein